eukprot:6389297-Amphidinium_carterae.1
MVDAKSKVINFHPNPSESLLYGCVTNPMEWRAAETVVCVPSSSDAPTSDSGVKLPYMRVGRSDALLKFAARRGLRNMSRVQMIDLAARLSVSLP